LTPEIEWLPVGWQAGLEAQLARALAGKKERAAGLAASPTHRESSTTPRFELVNSAAGYVEKKSQVDSSACRAEGCKKRAAGLKPEPRTTIPDPRPAKPEPRTPNPKPKSYTDAPVTPRPPPGQSSMMNKRFIRCAEDRAISIPPLAVKRI